VLYLLNEELSWIDNWGIDLSILTSQKVSVFNPSVVDEEMIIGSKKAAKVKCKAITQGTAEPQ
jgi:hypothetical protein